MIRLLVDEAYAFDYLSILDLKRQKSSDSYNAWINCYKYLENQFNNDKWQSMINSFEYREMLKANNLTFDAVEKAKNDEVSAQYVDECNYLRYKAKQNFQQKFFSENLSEIKLGYEKYARKSRIV